jgi:hypothetical protein
MIDNQYSKPKIYRLLSDPRIGRTYLLNSLASGSEKIFLDALHEIVEAISQSLGEAEAANDIDISSSCL